MTLLEKFQAMPPGANASIFLRDVAAALDAIAANIKALPQYNAATAPVMVPADIGSWTKALATANGWGDVLNRLRGMAESVDSINDWIAAQKVMPTQEMQPAKMSVEDRMAKARAAKSANRVR